MNEERSVNRPSGLPTTLQGTATIILLLALGLDEVSLSEAGFPLEHKMLAKKAALIAGIALCLAAVAMPGSVKPNKAQLALNKKAEAYNLKL